jgi:uncharacterized protein (TIGR02246 family)
MLCNRINKFALLAALLLLGAGGSAQAQMREAQTRTDSPAAGGPTETAGETAAVMTLLSSYEAALNASNTAAVMPLYAEDGVFMPPSNPSAVGAAAVRQAYDAVFKAIKLNVKFTVAEVVRVAPNWAFARTNSAGTVTVNATGAKSAEANQELFIFKKGADGAWKIARYSFSTTNPPLRQQ